MRIGQWGGRIDVIYLDKFQLLEAEKLLGP